VLVFDGEGGGGGKRAITVENENHVLVFGSERVVEAANEQPLSKMSKQARFSTVSARLPMVKGWSRMEEGGGGGGPAVAVEKRSGRGGGTPCAVAVE
jgi:hypothetical protein